MSEFIGTFLKGIAVLFVGLVVLSLVVCGGGALFGGIGYLVASVVGASDHTSMVVFWVSGWVGAMISGTSLVFTAADFL